MNGYGTPIYISAGYPFKINPPYVMTTPKKDWTTYEERNPTGQYKRTFQLKANSLLFRQDRQTFLRFEGRDERILCMGERREGGLFAGFDGAERI